MYAPSGKFFVPEASTLRPAHQWNLFITARQQENFGDVTITCKHQCSLLAKRKIATSRFRRRRRLFLAIVTDKTSVVCSWQIVRQTATFVRSWSNSSQQSKCIYEHMWKNALKCSPRTPTGALHGSALTGALPLHEPVRELLNATRVCGL